MFRKGVLVLLLLVAFITAYFMYNYAVNSKYRISSAEARKRIASHDADLILDVRTDTERQTLGFYPGSVHIASADLEREMPNRYPDKNLKIIAYCNTGHRARAATDKLQALGYKNARYISSNHTTLF